MIPRWLELEGIRSFSAPRTIDFADLGLFAVLGDTGAGKSSILEAIVYALFNGTTWDGSSVKELMSIGASRMRVRFCFQLNDRTYTVSRSKPREGVASHLLECAGCPDERRDGESGVNKRLEALLGVNRDTFTKTVVLPQGEFAALLALADKPAKRTELLTTILGLNRLDAMVETLAAPRDRARSLRARFQGSRTRLPEDPSAGVAAAEVTIGLTSERREGLDRALGVLDARQRVLDDISAAGTLRANVRERLARVPANLSALEALLSRDAGIASEIRSAIDRQRRADAARSEADEEMRRRILDGRDTAALTTVSSTLEKLRGAVRERDREQDDEAERRAAVAATEAAVLCAQTECRSAAQAADVMNAQVEGARSAVVIADAAWQTAQSANRNLVEARAGFADASAFAAQAAERVARAERACELAAVEHRAAEERSAATEALAADAVRANAVAFAAQNCIIGDTCPICDRPLPRDFAAPVAPDLEQAQRAVAEARRARQASQKHYAAVEAACDVAFQSRAEADARAEVARKALVRAMDDARAAGLDPAAADCADALNALRLAADERRSAFDAADLARRLADAHLAALRATHLGSVKADEREKRELANCQTRIRSRRIALEALLEALAPAWRPALDRDSIENRAADVAEALEDARGFDQQIHRAAVDAKDAKAALLALEGRRALEIFAPAQTLRFNLKIGAQALASYAGATNAAATGVDLSATVSPEPPEEAELVSVLDWARGLVGAISAALLGIDADAAADVGRIANERAAIAELLDGQSVTSRIDLAKLRDEALQAEAVARETLALAQTALRDAVDLDARLATLDPLARALDALHGALGDGKFKRFVATRKEQRLLGVATTILGRMTDERYGFGPAMRIVDRLAGQERSPQTLSGGEKFLASLALAFALVEIAARGGGHFGALFLDEGFGSLDLRALDQALAELERQAAGGRMIGVITHVREVSEYIDDVLRVWRTPGGSDVARLARADLDVLVAQTATLAIGNAQIP